VHDEEVDEVDALPEHDDEVPDEVA